MPTLPNSRNIRTLLTDPKTRRHTVSAIEEVDGTITTSMYYHEAKQLLLLVKDSFGQSFIAVIDSISPEDAATYITTRLIAPRMLPGSHELGHRFASHPCVAIARFDSTRPAIYDNPGIPLINL